MGPYRPTPHFILITIASIVVMAPTKLLEIYCPPFTDLIQHLAILYFNTAGSLFNLHIFLLKILQEHHFF